LCLNNNCYIKAGNDFVKAFTQIDTTTNEFNQNICDVLPDSPGCASNFDERLVSLNCFNSVNFNNPACFTDNTRTCADIHYDANYDFDSSLTKYISDVSDLNTYFCSDGELTSSSNGLCCLGNEAEFLE